MVAILLEHTLRLPFTEPGKCSALTYDCLLSNFRILLTFATFKRKRPELDLLIFDDLGAFEGATIIKNEGFYTKNAQKR